MSIMDKSIASRIALLLGLFCLVLCAFLISLLQLLKMLSEEADETVNVALPNMAIASYISKESEWRRASSTTASCAATVSSTLSRAGNRGPAFSENAGKPRSACRRSWGQGKIKEQLLN
ncbi:MAG: hypothetical protein ACLSTO_05495 [Bilophila wadsworthia]